MALLQRFSFILLFATLVGCGGSSGGFDENPDDGGGTTPDAITISLAISDKNLAKATPQTLTVTVMQGSTPLADKLVTFTLSNTELASFSTDVNTSSTGADGIAEIGLLAGASSGDGSVTASIDGIDSNAITFKSAGDGDAIGVILASEINLFASSQQIASSGNEEITLSTIAKDANNNLMEGVAISFSATSGQLQIVNSVTGEDGKASAILKTDDEPTNRIITVTSGSGQVTDTVDVQVTGTIITLNGSSSLAINDENKLFINVLNSDGKGIPNSIVNLSLSNSAEEGNVASITIAESVTTDINGQASFSVIGTSGGSNTIIATGLGATSEHNVTVQADSFLFTSFSNGSTTVNPEDGALPDVLLSENATIELTWNKSNIAIADGTEVSFTSTRGTPVTPVTIKDGKVTTTISSNNAGKALVTATGIKDGVTLSNQLEFEFVAENVATIHAQASPNSIAPGGDTSTISVVVKDSNGNLVKGKTIDFSVEDTSGGELLPASAVTDSNGAASTVYTSNTVSAQDGVLITATVRSASSVAATVTLTVADRELFMALGTGNDLIEIDSTAYNKQYSVFVTDVDSTPQEGVILKVSAVPNSYYKGDWVKRFSPDGSFAAWDAEYSDSTGCLNEDVNIDGILDVGEDTNMNGKLTPGNVVAVLGEVTTDEFGQAVIDIRYAQSFALWVDVNLIVSAKVSGTESSAKTTFTLPVLAADVLNEDISPPTSGIGLISPFGRASDCTNPD